MAFVPFLLYLLYEDSVLYGYIAAGLFVLASITDYLDGYFARKYKVESKLGKFLDPISDKLLVSAVLVMLVHLDRINPILVVALLSRDTLINGLRAVAASDNIVIAAGSLGKWKTAVQMIAIPAILIHQPVLGIPFYPIGNIGLWLSLVLSLVSGVQYIQGFLKKS